MMDKLEWADILKEVEELYSLHEKTVSDCTKCREFNRRSAHFLGRLEEMECDQLADRMMDLLGGCSPKDFSHCDNHERTKSSLERIKERVKENLDQRKQGSGARSS